MSTYALIRHQITNEEAYARYRALAGPSVKLHGGSLVTKGAVYTELEGTNPLDHMVLLAFPSAEAASTWFHSPEYTAAREARSGAGEMHISIINE